jgi:hypothetical protein
LQQQVMQLGYGEQITHLKQMKGAKNDDKRLTLLVGVGNGQDKTALRLIVL